MDVGPQAPPRAEAAAFRLIGWRLAGSLDSPFDGASPRLEVAASVPCSR